MGREDLELDAAMHPRLRRALQVLTALAMVAMLGGLGVLLYRSIEAPGQAEARAAAERQHAQQAQHQQYVALASPKIQARLAALETRIDALQAELAAEPAPTLETPETGRMDALREAALGQFTSAAELAAALDRLGRETEVLLARGRYRPATRGAIQGAYVTRVAALYARQGRLNARFASLQETLGELERAHAAADARARKIAEASHKDYADGHPVGEHLYSPNGRVMYPTHNGRGAVPVYQQAEENRAPRRKVYRLPEVW
ncbi:MAG: hypothetical protein AAGK14_02025 [Verrucomicrobiota bacterium]